MDTLPEQKENKRERGTEQQGWGGRVHSLYNSTIFLCEESSTTLLLNTHLKQINGFYCCVSQFKFLIGCHVCCFLCLDNWNTSRVCDFRTWGGYTFYISQNTSCRSLKMSHYVSWLNIPNVIAWNNPDRLKHALTRLKKKGPFSWHFQAEMWGSKKKKGILSVTDALCSATANETFPWVGNIHCLSGPAQPLASFFSANRVERTRWMPMSPGWPKWQMGWLYKLIPLATGKHNTLPAS